jgi:cell division protein FtsZ
MEDVASFRPKETAPREEAAPAPQPVRVAPSNPNYDSTPVYTAPSVPIQPVTPIQSDLSAPVRPQRREQTLNIPDFLNRKKN